MDSPNGASECHSWQGGKHHSCSRTHAGTVARALGWVSVGIFVQTAVGHSLAFGTFSSDATLWFVFPAQQVALGAIVAMALWKKSELTLPILVCSSLAPLFEAALLGIHLGPILPFFLVLMSGLMPLVTATLMMARRADCAK